MQALIAVVDEELLEGVELESLNHSWWLESVQTCAVFIVQEKHVDVDLYDSGFTVTHAQSKHSKLKPARQIDQEKIE